MARITPINSFGVGINSDLTKTGTGSIDVFLVTEPEKSDLNTSISTAQTAATNAQTAATNAQTDANTAQTTANTALTNANTALTTANTAQTTANFSLAKLANSTLTTTGTIPAFVLTTDSVLAVEALVTGLRLRVKFHASCSIESTINVNALGAKALKALSPYGSKITPFITINTVANIEYDGVDFILQGAQYGCGNALAKFRAEHSSAAAQTGIIGFNTEKYDATASYDGINKFTPPASGFYALNVTFRNGAAENYSWFLKKGVQISETLVTPANASATHQAALYLASGDYIQYYTTSATYAAANVLKFEGYMVT